MRRPDSHLEADVLAAALHAPEIHVRKMLSLLEPEDFDSPNTKSVFVAIANIAKVAGPANVSYAMVRDELRKMKADSRDVLRLIDPDLGLGTESSFEPKCRRLREIRQERLMHHGMLDLMQQDFDNPQDLMNAIAQMRDDVSSLSPATLKVFDEIVDEMMAEVEYDEQHQDRRIKTGLPTIDRYLHGGLAPGMLVVVGARTGVGKTTFAGQVAAKAAAENHRVMFFSMEESPTQVAERIIRYLARIPRHVGHRDIEGLMRAALDEHYRSLPLVLMQEYRLDVIVDEIGEQVVEQQGVDLVVVDYAGLVRVPGNWDSRVQEIGEVTRNLKLTAMEYRVPVMLLSQVNRSPMSRTDKRPQLSDLRDSGALEQDADVVILLHQSDDNPAEDSLRLAKHRYGATGRVPVRYDYPAGRVEEVSMRHA